MLEIVSRIGEVPRHLLQHPQHAASDFLLRIRVAREVAGEVTVDTLNAQRGIERLHECGKLHIGRQHLQISWWRCFARALLAGVGVGNRVTRSDASAAGKAAIRMTASQV